MSFEHSPRDPAVAIALDLLAPGFADKDFLMANKDPGYTHHMGPRLRAEVEKQLIDDFRRYAAEQRDDLTIDWSETCPEGHETAYLDGRLENWSDVCIVNAQGETVARGWIDFIHGSGDHPLFVFWYSLRFGANTEDVVRAQGIPQHIWENLPERTKALYLSSEADDHWANDPLVLQWRNQRSQR
jgi:hypothetical protein